MSRPAQPGSLTQPGGRSAQVIERDLIRDVGRAVADFDLISEGDRILVAVSGGKDSY
ncbi:MAG: tRNA 2-thiocytidine(32) synthetase TtcA, partial [Polyangia bacterium]